MRRPPLAALPLATLACSFDGTGLLSLGPSDGTTSGTGVATEPPLTTTSPSTTEPSTGSTTAVDSSTTVTPGCGDGTRDPGEDCDGSDLAGQTCTDLGLGGGDLLCAGDCTFDLTGCLPLPTCDGDEVDPGEECDGADLAGQTCESLGYDMGVLACAPNCLFDKSDCSKTPPENWYDPKFPRRRKLTIAAARVTGEHKDFPVAISTIDINLITGLAPVEKLVFTDDTNQVLDHELQLASADSTLLVVWVELPLITSTADNVFWVYYGNLDIADTSKPADTWSNKYLAVWHLDEPATDEMETEIHADATGKGHDGVQHQNKGIPMGCQLGRCQEIGMAEWIEVAKPAEFKLGNADATIAAWIKTSVLNPTGIFAKANPLMAENGNMVLGFFASRLAFERFGLLPASGVKNLTDNGWHHVAWTQNHDAMGNKESWQLYLDGVKEYDMVVDDVMATMDGHPVRIGGGAVGSSFPNNFFGQIDEIQVNLDAARSAEWIKTAYDNQLAPASFTQIGPEESL